MSDAVTMEWHETPEWLMALDHMEQMHPRYLASLLADGTLAEVLEQLARHYVQTLNKVRECLPSAEWDQIEEMVHADIFPINPNWQDEELLSDEEEEQLRAFREKYGWA